MTQRQRRRSRRRGGASSKILFVLAAVLALGVALTIGVASWVLDVAAKAPPLSACKPIDQGGNSVLFAGDGSRLGYIASDEARTPVAIKRVPADLKHATVAIEDERFYEHDGIDYEGGLRALVQNVEAGKIVQGGSTITMQLMRNLCITDPKRNIERKIQEAQLALEYEKKFSQGRHPRQVPERGLLRDGQRQHRGRGPGRLGDLLLEAGLEADPRAIGAARRPPAGALGLQPDPQPQGGQRTPQRGPRENGRPRLHLETAGAAG